MIGKNRRSVGRFGAVFASLTVLTVAGCGASATESDGLASDWDAILEAAEQEGSVTLTTNTSPAHTAALLDAFEDEYPEIEVILDRGSSEIEARLSSEISGGQGETDVVMMTHREWNLDHQEDFIHLEDVLPALDEWPNDGWSVPGAGPTITTYPTSLITWNTDIFPEGFSNWDDLLDDEVQGQLGVRDNVSMDVAGILQMLEDSQGEEFLPAFADQEPSLYPSLVPMTQAVGAGEIGVSAGGDVPSATEVIDSGAPLDWVAPEDIWVMPVPITILENSDHPNASAVFVNFALSPEGQVAVNGDERGMSVLPDVDGALNLDDHNVTVADPGETTTDDVREWSDRHTELFK